MKVLTILGARPQFIKASSVSRVIALRKPYIEEVIVHTGQHYDHNMSDVFFHEMKIQKPSYYLGVGGVSHGKMTGEMIKKIENIIIKENPDWILVYGDTNSTLAGAIAASKLQVKIAHVEAGLRSFNMSMPEEVNRILTDRVSTLLFCPSELAVSNLKNEGINSWKNGAKIILSGDVMKDSAIFYKDLAKPLKNLRIDNDFVLCTIHRAENTDNDKKIDEIIYSLQQISQFKQVVLPLHPRTKKILVNKGLDLGNISIIDPVGFLNMVWLLDNCSLVITDSGGLQKEAFYFRKSCIILRDETEWHELLESNVSVLVGSNTEKIITEFKNIKPFNSTNNNIYGDGKASEKIVNGLLHN